MATIPKIISKSTNGEVDATANALIAVLAKNDWSADAFLSTTETELKALHSSINGAIKRGKTESQLEEKDAVRDEALSELFNLVKGLQSVSGETGEAAKVIMPILNRYGLSATADANYANESAYINSMITDLGEPPVINHVLAVPFIQDAMAKLALAQQDFEQSYNSYVTAMEAENAQESATSIKGNMVKLINENLVEYLRVMQKVSAETYGELAADIAGVLNDNNERVKRRKSATNDDETEALSSASEE